MTRVPLRPARVALARGGGWSGCSSSGGSGSARPCDGSHPPTTAGATDGSRDEGRCAIPIARATPQARAVLAEQRRGGRSLAASAPAAGARRAEPSSPIASTSESRPDAELVDVGAELDPDAERPGQDGHAMPGGSPPDAASVIPDLPLVPAPRVTPAKPETPAK